MTQAKSTIMKNFENKEIEMIQESFELRKESADDEHINKLNQITEKLLLPIKHLTALQRAIIRGCVKDYIIYPNEDLLGKSEYEILLSRKEIEEDCLKIDTASNILNKTRPRTESKRILFQQIFNKIDKISNSKLIHYSITTEGKIYKVGIVTEKNKGMRIELCLCSVLTNFKIGFLSNNSFMNSAKPIEIVNYLKHYGKMNKLTENHRRFIRIMEMPALKNK